jgi:hypothetical protein
MANSHDNIAEQNDSVTLNNNDTTAPSHALEGRTLADQAAIIEREKNAQLTEKTPKHTEEAHKEKAAQKQREDAYEEQSKREEKHDKKEAKSRQAGDNFELVDEIAEYHNDIKAIEAEREEIAQEASKEIVTNVEKSLGRPLTDEEKTAFEGIAKSIFEQSADSRSSQISYGEDVDRLLEKFPPEIRGTILFEAETIASKDMFGQETPGEKSYGQDYRQKGGEIDTLQDKIDNHESNNQGGHRSIADIEQQTEGVVTEQVEHLTLERTTRPEYLHQTAMEMVAYYKASGLSMSAFKDDMAILDISEFEHEAILKVFDREGFEITPDTPAPTPNQTPQVAQSTTQPAPQRELEPEINNNNLTPTVGFS